MDSVFKEDIIRHMFIVITSLMIRLHNWNTIQLTTQYIRIKMGAIAMQNKRRHGRTMLTFTRLIHCFQFKYVIYKDTFIESRMQLKWCTVKKRCNRREIADAISKNPWRTIALF
ncbi:hypothetical protein D3C84_622090 [compost metagenome]